MRTTAILFTLSCLLAACQSSSEEKQAKDLPEQAADTVPPEQLLTVKDRNQYSTQFIEAVMSLGFRHVELADSVLTLDGTEQYHFPSYPPRRVTRAFFAEEAGNTVKLLVERINETTLNYRVDSGRDHHLELVRQGKADISVQSIFQPQIELLSATGQRFPVSQYHDVSKGCTTVICIGLPDGASKMQGKIWQNCDGTTTSLGSKEPLILIEK